MIDWINLYKGILICLVFLGHSNLGNDYIYRLIYAFHMPAFFIISGYLYRDYNDYKIFIQKKFKRLIIPYVGYAFFLSLALEILSKIIKGNFVDNIEVLAEGLWFLPCMFWVLIIYFFLGKLKFVSNNFKIRSLGILLLLIIGIIFNNFNIKLPFYIINALYAIVFFHVGYYVKINNKKILNLNFWYLLLVVVIVSVVTIFYPMRMDLRTLTMDPIVLRIICAICLSVFLIYVTKAINNISILNYMGINSLDFYALGAYIPYIMDICIGKIGIWSKIISFVVMFLIVVIKNKLLNKSSSSVQ